MEAIEEHLSNCLTCCLHVEDSPDDNFVEQLRQARARSSRTASGVSATSADAWEPRELRGHERYRVDRLLGQGGMGAVCLAEHRRMKRTVALKVINPALLTHPGALSRFQQEVRAAANLDHPNIVAAYDADQAEGLHFLVMEHVEGQNLADYLAAKGPLPVVEACEVIRQAALGLQHAHERGMVHRDIKPNNLMRTASGRTKVLDFGLARFACEPGHATEGSEPTTAAHLTGAGSVLGTADYMAPEQARDSHEADRRSDIYSLGCTLYHLLTNRPPFPEGTAPEKLRRHSSDVPHRLSALRPETPPGLVRIVDRMMAKRPEDRYQTAAEVAVALAPYATGLPPKRSWLRRTWLAVTTSLLLVGLVCGAGAVYRIQTAEGEVVITPNSPDVEIVLLQGGQEVRVIDTKTRKKVMLPIGSYDVALKGKPAGLEVTTDRIVVRRGQEALVTIERVANKKEPSLATARVGAPPATAPGAGEEASEPPAPMQAVEVLRKRWPEHEFTSGVDLSPDGRLLISMHWGGVRVWEVATGKVVHEWPGWLAVFTPDGKQIVSTIVPDANRNQLALHETASGRLIRQFGPHPHGIWGLNMCPDGKGVVTAGDGNDPVSRYWDLATDEMIASTNGRESLAISAKLRGDRNRIVVDFQNRTGLSPGYVLPGGREITSNLVEDRFVPVHEISSGKLVRKIPLADSGKVEIIGNVQSGQRLGKRMAWSLADGTIVVLDLAAGKEVARFRSGIFAPKCLAISADDRFVAACASNEKSEVVVWRLPDPAPEKAVRERTKSAEVEAEPSQPPAVQVGEVRRIRWEAGPIWNADISPDGKYYMAGGGPGGRQTVRVFEIATGKKVDEFFAYLGRFTPDGKHIVTATGDSFTEYRIAVRRADTGKLLREIEAKGWIWNFSIFPDSKRIITTTDKSRHIFDLETGKELPEGTSDSSREAREVKRVECDKFLKDNVAHAFSSDQRRLLVAYPDRTVALWDTVTGKELCRFRVADGDVVNRYLGMTADGRYGVGGTHSGVLYLWRLPDRLAGDKVSAVKPGQAKGRDTRTSGCQRVRSTTPAAAPPPQPAPDAVLPFHPVIC